MRGLILAMLLILPSLSHAGLLDLLPLKKIERKMLYPLSSVEVDPRLLGLKRVAVHDLNDDNHRLLVWVLKASVPNAPTVLYFHGNAGNLATRAARFAEFQAQGFNVIAMSYRGSSGSGGKPSEAGISADARQVYKQAEKLIANTTPQKIILYGESLGSAVAIALLEALAPDERPAGLVLEAPFTSIPAMAQTMADIPPKLIARISDRWDSLSRVKAITVPLLILHGTADEVTPISMGRALFAHAPVKDKDFIAVRGASHEGTWRSDTVKRLYRFIHTYAH